MSDEKIDVLLLISGGIDSTALLHYYLSKNEKVKCIHFNYDQPNEQSEKDSIEKISKYYGTEIEQVKLSFTMANVNDEVLCRNAIFILVAASLGYNPNRISIGIHADSTYYDASPKFIDECQALLDGYFSGLIQIDTPFLDFTKMDIIDYCKKEKVPLKLTYSCFKKNYPPCGECPACLDRRVLNENK